MSFFLQNGQRFVESTQMQLIDMLLDSRQLLGHRCWGIVNLYYQCGLSHTEIAEVFNIKRQAVTSQILRAWRTFLKAVATDDPLIAHLAVNLTDRHRELAMKLLYGTPAKSSRGSDKSEEKPAASPDAQDCSVPETLVLQVS